MIPRLLLFLLVVAVVHADPSITARDARVTLDDDSTVIGKLSTLEDGRYVLDAGTDGEVIIEDGKVVSIDYLDAPADAEKTNIAVEKSVDAATEQVLQNTDLTQSIGNGMAGLNAEIDRISERVAAGEATPEEIARLKKFAETGNPADLGVEGFDWLDQPMLDLLNDPEVAQAIQDGDYLKLMTNPKVQKLTGNSQAMRRLIDQTLGRSTPTDETQVMSPPPTSEEIAEGPTQPADAD